MRNSPCLANLMGAVYVAAGITHFLLPDYYLRMLPRPFIFPMAAVYISGAAEILLGAALWYAPARKWSAMGIIILLIAVFPANINMALQADEWNIPRWLLYMRLPMQLLLILWAWCVVKKSGTTRQ
ncbi:MAG: DoxX family protein [Chitinophagales bacterium]|nr:DoxX family protein [Chitinophagales bacterium]MDW8418649.1 DoxX family protein [Chitinophagales bacterium]